MNTTDVARALEEWAVDAAGVNSSFDYPPESLDQAMPLVIAEVTRKERNQAPTAFRDRQYEQMSIRTWTADLTLLVSPDPAWTASHSLYDYVDALEAALYQDVTLGGRVGFAEKSIDASFDPPEVEFSDGTSARQATFSMTVGEQLEV